MMTPGPAPDAVAPAQEPDKRGTLVLPGPGRDVALGLDGDDFSASDHLVGHFRLQCSAVVVLAVVVVVGVVVVVIVLGLSLLCARHVVGVMVVVAPVVVVALVVSL